MRQGNKSEASYRQSSCRSTARSWLLDLDNSGMRATSRRAAGRRGRARLHGQEDGLEQVVDAVAEEHRDGDEHLPR